MESKISYVTSKDTAAGTKINIQLYESQNEI